MNITQAQADECIALTQLMRQAKAHWGYSAEQMQLWQNELTITPEYLMSFEVFTLQSNQQIIGFYAFSFVDTAVAKLDSLFIAPTEMGQGYGQSLFNDFVHRVTSQQANKVTLDADPNAEGFYLRLGFTTVGQKPSSIKNRSLPIMQLHL